MNFGERLKKALKSSGYSQKVFSKKIGVSTVSISAYLNKGILPNVQVVIEIANLLDISLDWLLLGKGSMQPGIKKPVTPAGEMDIWQRLEFVRADRDIPLDDFLKMIHLSRQDYTDLQHRRRNPLDQKSIVAIIENNINIKWLLTGKGNVYTNVADTDTFGKRLRAFRVHRMNLAQDQFADSLNVDIFHYARLENGQKDETLRIIEKLSEYISIDYLVTGDEDLITRKPTDTRHQRAIIGHYKNGYGTQSSAVAQDPSTYNDKDPEK